MAKTYKHKDILLACNYYISYDYNEDNCEGVVVCNLVDSFTHTIKYNPNAETLSSTFHKQSISCPRYAAKSIAEFYVKDICKFYGYPYYFLFYDNSKNEFRFFESEMDEQQNMEILCNDLYNGLTPEIVSLSKDSNIWDGMKIMSETMLGLKIQ